MSWLNWPNRITIARIILIAPLVICLLNINSGGEGWRYLAIALFGLMAISDGVDGYLARRLQAETQLGRFLDPLGDKLLITSAVILLAVEQTSVPGFRLPNWVPVIAVAKDVLTVAGYSVVRSAAGSFFIHPRIWGKACTLVQLVMIAFCLVAPNLPAPAQKLFVPIYWLASALAVSALIDYVVVGSRRAATTLTHEEGSDRDDR